MREKIVLFSLFISITTSIHAHDTRKAFFHVEEISEGIKIRAEFPWTIRNSLIKEFPQLKNATDKLAFKKTFFSYCKATIQLVDINGRAFELIEAIEVKNGNNSHALTYDFIFLGTHLLEVKNSMMFNLNEDQENHHFITMNGQNLNFMTTIEKPSFILHYKNQNLIQLPFLIVGVLILIAVFGIWRFRMTSKRKQS